LRHSATHSALRKRGLTMLEVEHTSPQQSLAIMSFPKVTPILKTL
jgi:hypothetical protein